ncbi:hypothetical protein SDC9_197721 [bioreactor metagenome]|uniref:Uncharacterized protein n=1 Tax=bioreactor metagenome TaxID=1076179 RepID=A0A645IFM8_9ZZZZ
MNNSKGAVGFPMALFSFYKRDTYIISFQERVERNADKSHGSFRKYGIQRPDYARKTAERDL